MDPVGSWDRGISTFSGDHSRAPVARRTLARQLQHIFSPAPLTTSVSTMSAGELPAPSPLTKEYWQALMKEHSAAVFAFSFLVAVGVLKTLLTKLIFTHSPTPVAFSVLSCIATNICLLPILLIRGEFRWLSSKALLNFAFICLAIALDLGCQNVALAILSVALQQCIKATLPTFTVIVESVIRRKKFHIAIYATVASICIGPILVASGSSWKAKSEAGSQLFGAIMMMVAMLGGGFKYVLCHKAISEFRKDMGVLAFTFWVECFVGLMLAPWAIANGEAYRLITEKQTPGAWALLWFTGAFGGVRVVAQFYFLAKTSATSLAMSGIAMQALTIILGIIFFKTPVTGLLVFGVIFTVVTSSIYTYLKTSSVLQTGIAKAPPKDPEKLMEVVEARTGLRAADAMNSGDQDVDMSDHLAAAAPQKELPA
jgi:drug/metabolite transporter (DMT)-like permease